MSLRIQRNIEDVFVPEDVSITSSKGGKNISVIPVNEIYVCSPGGTCLDTTTYANFDRFRIGYNLTGQDPVMSDVIPMATLKNYKGALSVAPAEQVDYIGYNGTANSISVVDSNLYMARFWFKGFTENQFSDQLVRHGIYTSDSSATQSEVAAGLTSNMVANLSNKNDDYDIKVERVYSGAQDDALATATASLTNNSKYVVFSEDLTALVVAGSILRFGTSGAGTAPCYIVTAHDSGAAAARIYTLDVAYQGATAATFAANTVETAATGGNWGIKLTAVARTFAVGRWPWSKTSWDLQLEDFGTTEVTNTTASNLGSGAYQQISEAEWFAQGNSGGDLSYYSRAHAPVATRRSDVVVDDFYSVLSFDYADVITNEIGPSNTSPKSIYIAMNVGSTAAAAISATSFKDSGTDGLIEVLDAIAANSSMYVNTAQLANV
jgi:hypothetical protein